jgi:hypothetical protein
MTAPVDPRIAKESASIARQTMSPFCPGRTLADCPSPNAAAWRAEIQELLTQGKSPSEIQALFEGRAERDLSGIPHREIGYGLSVAIALSFALVLVLIFRRLRYHRAPLAPAPPEALGAVDDDRLREELERVE